jgi:L-fuconolactonase
MPETLASILKRNRFDGSIAAAMAHETQWLLELASQHEFIRGVLGRTAALDEVDGFQRHPKFRGICARVDGPIAAKELERRGLTLDVEADASELPRVSRLAESAPELRLVIDHMAIGPFAEWERGVAELARAPKVFCKISGVFRSGGVDVRPYVRHLLGLFGPERLMFGSDWPAALPQYSWKENLACFTQAIGAQTIETREQLLGETARRVYRLD